MVGWCAFSRADLHPPGNAHARDGDDLFQDVLKSSELSLHCNGSESSSYPDARDVLAKQSLNFGINCLRVDEGGLARWRDAFVSVNVNGGPSMRSGILGACPRQQVCPRVGRHGNFEV